MHRMPGGMPGMPGGMVGAHAGLASWLIAYALIFLVLFAAAYWLAMRKARFRPGFRPGHEAMAVASLLCIGLLVRVSAATLMAGHPFDISTFARWATAAANGLGHFYAKPGFSDYPPLYIYILFLIGKIASIPAVNPYYTLLLKLPSMMADITTSYLIYRLARRSLSPEIGILASAFYVFNPAVIINSTFWGQVDSCFTLIVASSVFMLAESKIGPASALFTAAVMMKPQGIIFLPVLGFELLRQHKLQGFLTAVGSALGTAAVIVLPFSLSSGILWIFRLFTSTVAEYPYASVNAFNLFGLLGANYTKDSSTLFLLSYHGWGLLFIAVVTALAWFIYRRGNSRVFAAAAALLQIAGVFIFATRMHERYLFPAVALSMLAFTYLRDRRLLLLSAGFSVTSYVNTHVVLFGTMKGINAAPFNPALVVVSILNLLLFAYLVKVLFDAAIRRRWGMESAP